MIGYGGGRAFRAWRAPKGKLVTVEVVPESTAGAPSKVDYSGVPDHPSVGPGKSFTQTKKKNLLEANRQQNGGTLRSDQSGVELVPGQRHKRGVTPPANEAHVHHIIPKSKNGPNSSANAQGNRSHPRAIFLGKLI